MEKLALVTRDLFWRWQIGAWLAYGIAMFIAAAQELPIDQAAVNKTANTLIGFALSLALRELYARLRRRGVALTTVLAVIAAACLAGGALWSVLANSFFWWYVGVDFSKVGAGAVFAWTLLHAYVLIAWCAVFVGATLFDELQRARALDLARVAAPPAAAATLVVRADGETVRLDQTEILSIEAARNYSCIVATRGTYVVRMTLAALEKQLDPARFLRVHRSAIVAVGAVRGVRALPTQDAVATLEDGRELRVSRGFRARLEQALAG